MSQCSPSYFWRVFYRPWYSLWSLTQTTLGYNLWGRHIFTNINEKYYLKGLKYQTKETKRNSFIIIIIWSADFCRRRLNIETKDLVSAKSSKFLRRFQKHSTAFNSKVSQNGKEWRLDNRIEQSWCYFEPPCKTRANNLDQETSAEFEGFWAAKNSSFWNLGHKQSRTGREITAQFIMGRSYWLGGHKTRMKFEHWAYSNYLSTYLVSNTRSFKVQSQGYSEAKYYSISFQ